MPLMETVTADAVKLWSAIGHAAAWLVGWAAFAEQDVQKIEADSPLVKAAIVAGEAAAAAHGVPVGAIETAAEDVLALARKVSGGAS